MKEETNSNEKSKSSIGEHKGKPTIVSGFLNFTKPPSDDDWGDELEDGMNDFIAKNKKPTYIEDDYEEYGN